MKLAVLFRCGIAAATAALLAGSAPAAAAPITACKFDTVALKFEGDAIQQAKCLLRPVRQGALLGPVLTTLPAPLDSLIGQSVAVTKPALRAFLTSKTIAEADIGGSLDEPVSRGRNGAAGGPLAAYFVIHDTSSPNCSKPGCAELGKFPTNMDDASWKFNTTALITKHASGNPVAHMFVARTGQSKTGHNFKTPFPAVKLEGRVPNRAAVGLFLHVENVQPRSGKPAIPAKGRRANDLIAPDPGFSDPQYERLALLYIAASVRRGQWLIPAFHAAIDSGLNDAHDDPQKFDLQKWGDTLAAMLRAIGPQT
jgi:hypothetical protein